MNTIFPKQVQREAQQLQRHNKQKQVKGHRKMQNGGKVPK